MGTAMGTRAAPTFANIFMAKIDKWVLTASNSCAYFFKRFIDEIFMLWTGSETEFLDFMTQINSIHPTIKFTHSYNLEERSTTFLAQTPLSHTLTSWATPAPGLNHSLSLD